MVTDRSLVKTGGTERQRLRMALSTLDRLSLGTVEDDVSIVVRA